MSILDHVESGDPAIDDSPKNTVFTIVITTYSGILSPFQAVKEVKLSDLVIDSYHIHESFDNVIDASGFVDGYNNDEIGEYSLDHIKQFGTSNVSFKPYDDNTLKIIIRKCTFIENFLIGGIIKKD